MHINEFNEQFIAECFELSGVKLTDPLSVNIVSGMFSQIFNVVVSNNLIDESTVPYLYIDDSTENDTDEMEPERCLIMLPSVLYFSYKGQITIVCAEQTENGITLFANDERFNSAAVNLSYIEFVNNQINFLIKDFIDSGFPLTSYDAS